MTSKSVLIVHQHANPPDEPGITRHFQVAKTLKQLGYEVEIAAGDIIHFSRKRRSGADRIQSFEGVKYHWLPVNKYAASYVGRVFSMFIFALQVLNLKRADFNNGLSLIIGSSPSLLSAFAAYWLAKRWKVPFVFEVRDLWPKTIVELGGVKSWHPLVQLFGLIEKFLCRNADHIITVLPGASDYLISRGAKAHAITWIPNFVDLELVPFVPPSDKTTFHAVYAGSFGLANSMDTIIEAALILSKTPGKSKEIHFTLIGEGPRKSEIEELVKTHQLSNIQILPPLKKPEIYKFLVQADVFLMPVLKSNLYKSGMSPNKLFDYMACARPIIFSSGVEHNPVKLSGGGMCVPPEDPAAFARALIKLAETPLDGRLTMGIQARRYVEDLHSVRAIRLSFQKVLNGFAAHV